MLQLPPIPASILGISNILIEDAKINNNGEFIIIVKNENSEINCSKCNAPTSPHGYGRMIKLRHLPVFGHQTYIHKILTGRKDKLVTIKKDGGISRAMKKQEDKICAKNIMAKD